MKRPCIDLRHELLSELHRLLSIATAEDFLAASQLCRSENIRLALEALAEEHKADPCGMSVNLTQGTSSMQQDSNPSSKTGSQAKVGSKKADGSVASVKQSEQKHSKSSQGQKRIEERAVFRALKSVTRFPTRIELLRFAENHHLAVPSDNKASRDRIIVKLTKQITDLANDARNRVLSDLLNHADTQTAGWAQVIKSRE